MSSTTTNYGFTVCTGNDLVNPLTQIFPNFTSLDTILRNIANTGITTATEVKTGTVHALTRADTAVSMIRFQAVSRFDSGDTFTVDGVSVTATLPDGETMPDGGYIIGSMVLCELRDTQLTIYTSDSIANVNAAFNIGNTDISAIGDGSIKGAISTINANLTESYSQTADSNRYTATCLIRNGVKYVNLVCVGVSLSDSQNLYITFAEKLRPSSDTGRIYGLARCSDGTTTEAVINVATNGDCSIAFYNYGTKTVTGFIGTGFYN